MKIMIVTATLWRGIGSGGRLHVALGQDSPGCAGKSPILLDRSEVSMVVDDRWSRRVAGAVADFHLTEAASRLVAATDPEVWAARACLRCSDGWVERGRPSPVVADPGDEPPLLYSIQPTAEHALIFDRPQGMRCSEDEPYDFGSIFPGGCIVDVDPTEYYLPAPDDPAPAPDLARALADSITAARDRFHQETP